jgi:hypothetical protein
VAEPFEVTSDGHVVGVLEPTEKVVLVELLSQLTELLTPEQEEHLDPLAQEVGIGTETPEPTDPVLKRLLPNAYRFDPEKANEFRRYTERDLRVGKISRANAMEAVLREAGDEITLSREQAEVWAMSLADLRVALGAKLGLFDEVRDVSLKGDSPEQSVYDWLTWLQGSVIEALQS